MQRNPRDRLVNSPSEQIFAIYNQHEEKQGFLIIFDPIVPLIISFFPAGLAAGLNQLQERD